MTKYKIELITLFFICLPLITFPQENKGINFALGLNFMEIKNKAKSENKYIFMDCFATWCGPCKLMDKEVYSLEKVGEYFNAHFISIKVQMDSSMKDDQHLINWYFDANTIRQMYQVKSYPSYLFFSPDGKIVHRGTGALNDEQLITIAKNAMDTNYQYYKLLEKYTEGKIEDSLMIYLVEQEKSLGNITEANAIAKKYKERYLDKLSLEELCTKRNLEFAREYYNLIGSNDVFFNLFYNYPKKVDSVLNDKEFAKSFSNYIIKKEEIDEVLFKNNMPVTSKPDWNRIKSKINSKYKDSFSEQNFLDAQLAFYNIIKDWSNFAKFRELKISKFPPKISKIDLGIASDSWSLNSDAWDIFLFCDDNAILAKALTWIELAIKLEEPNSSVQYLDTRANILYKMGRVHEAIDQEKKAIEIGLMNAKKRGDEKGDFYDDYNAVLIKFRNGQPTWPVIIKN